MAKEGLVKKEQGQLFPCFIANRESKAFGILKLSALLLSLEETGLIQEIMKFYPDCIVLFGSASKGEDTEKSDIDLFVQAKAVNLKTDQFEKKLNRRINLIFEENIPALQKELLNNLANGIVIRGYLKVI